MGALSSFPKDKVGKSWNRQGEQNPSDKRGFLGSSDFYSSLPLRSPGVGEGPKVEA
jgi:hypothetical protein